MTKEERKKIKELESDINKTFNVMNKKIDELEAQLTKATKLLQEVQVYTENIDDEADALYDKIQQFLNENEVEG